MFMNQRLAWRSIDGQPRPRTVSAMIMLGRPLSNGSRPKVSSISAKEWPSILSVRQPNASNFASSDSSISSDNGADGFLYGADLGYDHQMGRFVLGAEGEVSGSTSKTADDPNTTDALGYGRVKAGRDLYAGVRAGYLVGPSTMLYAKGGYTNARLDLTAADGTTTTGQHFNLDGYRLGAGVEQAIGSNTYAKLEYRYSNYGNARLEYANGANTDNFNVDTDRHEVVAGVGLRF